MKGLSVYSVGAALALLLTVKIFISFLFLEPKGFSWVPADLALAGGAVQAEPEGDPAPSPAPLDLSALRNKEQQLKERESALERRERELLPLKKEIEEKLAELNELQARLTAYAGELADREEALEDTKIKHLVALYSAMDPAKAAAIMAELKVETIVRIMRSMKGKSAGQILSMMKPERGALISERLSQLD